MVRGLAAREHVDMDLGKRESEIAIITEAGELIEKRMRTEQERLRGVAGRGAQRALTAKVRFREGLTSPEAGEADQFVEYVEKSGLGECRARHPLG